MQSSAQSTRRTGWSAGVALAIAVSSLLSAAPAHGDEPASATASAESQALFDDAMALIDAGKYGEACPKLEASLKLDPGIGTRYQLADCYEHTGKLASAYSMFRDIEEAAKKNDQKAEAARRAKSLEPRLVRVVIDVPDKVRGLPDLLVQRGGATLFVGQFGTAVPVDPGAVVIVARARGKKPWNVTLEATKEGATFNVQVPMLEDESRSAPPSPAPIIPDDTSAWSSQRMAGVVAAGLGVVSAGIGAGLGAVALDLKSASEKGDHCDRTAMCDDTGLALRSVGRSAGDASTALFIAGGVLVGGGAILILTSPKAGEKKADKPEVIAFVGAGSVGLRGRW